MEFSLFVLGLIALLDVPFLWQQGQRRLRRAFWTLWGIALLYCLAAALNWQFLNPTHLIEMLLNPLAQAFPNG